MPIGTPTAYRDAHKDAYRDAGSPTVDAHNDVIREQSVPPGISLEREK